MIWKVIVLNTSTKILTHHIGSEFILWYDVYVVAQIVKMKQRVLKTPDWLSQAHRHDVLYFPTEQFIV